VRVTFSDASVVTFERPSIVADSIQGSTASGDVRRSVADVRGLEVRRSSVAKTGAFFVLQAAAVVSFIALVVHVQPHYRGF
jgi:hypothetical protein